MDEVHLNRQRLHSKHRVRCATRIQYGHSNSNNNNNRNICIVMLLFNLMITIRQEVNCNVSPERRLSSRVVTTKYGTLRGFIMTLPNKSLQSVEVFLGIPYASPPIGKLRFMPPVTSAHWNGIKSAHITGPVCPQKLPDIKNETLALQRMTQGRLNVLKRLLPMLQNQSEDCLYLNIYTPAVGNKENVRLPVVMFIHGESYEWNAGSTYDGSVLSSFANLVVVTINYRLGVLGFLPALDGISRGNFGLMDQVAALHWIQENIHEFGGDASNVTIMGQGYGATAVNLLMLSPMAKGLFHRAIMQSGSALGPAAMATDSIRYTRQLAKIVGCPDNWERNSQIVECLRQKSVKELLSVDFKVPTHLTAFGPMVDGVVVPNDPNLVMADAGSLYGTYDLLLGVTKAEAYNHFNAYDEKHGIDLSRRDRILRTLVRNLFTFHLQEIYLTIGNEYTDWSRSALHPSTIFDSLVDALGDATVVGPLIRAALFHSRRKKSTFLYAFLYATEEGDFPSKLGCIHGEDLLYAFGAPLVSGMQLGFFSKTFTKQETSLSEAVMNYWSNFVKHGDPNSNSLSKEEEKEKNEKNNAKSRDRFEKLLWPQYEEQQQQYLAITMKPKVRDHYHAHRLSYWVQLIPRLHVPGSPTVDHHLLSDHEQLTSYDGVVRDMTVSTSSLYTNRFLTTQSSNSNLDSAQNAEKSNSSLNETSVHLMTVPPKTGKENDSHQQSALDASVNSNLNSSVSVTAPVNYSTALSVTIAIGCSLLILNVLVFAGIFYQRDKERRNASQRSNNAYQDENIKNKIDELSLTKNSTLHSPHMFLENNSYIEPKGAELPNDLTITNKPTPMVVQHWINQQSISPSLGNYQTTGGQKLTTTGTVHVSLGNRSFNPSPNLPLNDAKINVVNMIDTLTEQHMKSMSSDI